jgi:hypothetical protein
VEEFLVFEIIISVLKMFVGKPERRRPLRKPRHRYKDNIKVDLWEIRCEGVDGIY